MKGKFLLALALILLLPAGLAWAQGGKKIVLKAGHVVDDNHPYHHGLQKMSDILSQKTDGRISIQIYHSSQLGNERDLIEGMGMGTVDMAGTSSAPASGFVPGFTVFDLPYIFTSREHAYKVMDGDVGRELLDQLAEKDVIGLGYFENGFREITNSVRPIVKPEDLRNIKIRVMESPAPIATFRALGANPTPMAWGEVFTAMQQKTIDAQENPLPVIFGQRVYEVQKYLSMTDHFYAPALLLISRHTLESFSEADQKVIREAAAEAVTYERLVSKQQADDYLQQLKEKGLEVNENVDKAAFIEATKPVYAEFEKEFGQLIKRIRETQ
ncbi:MAG: TRAP transporter substrate-binding protein [Candidatus Adiutrix sp.]|jgi:tripartite ATP-independent transporter DctP family solute receptor|nr:TRAP transporter substrate-binding protein [Candidatus Adiutrix sp.]